jgi:hypothetical protein
LRGIVAFTPPGPLRTEIMRFTGEPSPPGPSVTGRALLAN